MIQYDNSERLVIFDLDGTTVDAFHAIESAFLRHGMDIGDIDRFQKRRKLFLNFWAACANSPSICATSSANKAVNNCANH